MGGMLCGIKKGVKSQSVNITANNNLMAIEVNIRGETHSVIGLYNAEGLKNLKQDIEDHSQRHPERTIIIGDWNARLGTLGDCNDDNAHRATKDPKINEEGRRWYELLRKLGLIVLNGNTDGDWEGEFTRDGHTSSTVIDYAATTPLVHSELLTFRVDPKIESDHHPLVIKWEPIQREPLPEKVITTNNWDAEATNRYRQKLQQNLETNPNWPAIARSIRNATETKTYVQRRDSHNNRKWFDRECWAARRKVKEALKASRRQPLLHDIYLTRRKHYKKLLKNKKKKDDDDFKKRLDSVRNITEAWCFINKERRNKRKVKIGLTDTELAHHFKMLLGGTNERPRQSRTNNNAIQTEDICEAEVRESIQSMKKKKATGPDGIQAEALIAGVDILSKDLARLFNDIINGGAMPEEWRETKYWPIYKKGKRDDAANYRGIAISTAIYKLFAQIICNRLTKETEATRILPQTQSGFRKGRSTIDNIYILDTCANLQINSKKHLYALFIDLKAAFDSIDRTRLWTTLRRKGISEYIVRCCEEIYRVTPITIGSDTFYTTRGVKQGCPLSPILFAIYLNDIEEVLKKAQEGGTTMGKHRICSLAYADDMVLLADSAKEMKGMMTVLDRYLLRRNLELNTDKTKIIRFCKSGRLSIHTWAWKGKTIEEVKEFKYLGFTFKSNGTANGHVSAVNTEAQKKIGETWSIGERRFKNNFNLRMAMFDSLIKSGLLYGAEVYGWKIREENEATQRKFIKWTLGLRPNTKNEIVLAESGRMPVYLQAAVKAMQFEIRIEKSPNPILKEALALRLNRNDRQAFFRGVNLDPESERLLWTQNRPEWLNVAQAARTGALQKIDEALQGSTYAEIRPKEIPEYLAGRDIKTIARFRCGNEEKARDRWRTEEEKLCRICHLEEETIYHMMTTCCPTTLREEEILDVNGSGQEWMREVMRVRLL